MCSRIINYLLSPLRFIRGVSTETFRKRDKVDFPNSSGLNFLTFSWLTDWILLKSHRELKDSELPCVDPVDKDLSKVEIFESILEKPPKWTCFIKCDKLYVAIYLTFWKSFLILLILGLIRDVMEFLNVLLLKTILKNMQNQSKIDNKILGAFVTTLLCVLQTFDIFFDTHFFYYYYRLQIRIECTLGSLISKRAIYNPANADEKNYCDEMKLDDGANLLNLQLFDIENASWGALAVTDLLLTPIRVIIIASWMYNQVGSSSTSSTAIVGIITVFMCFLQIKSSSFVKLYLKKLDTRVLETKNILDNIRTFRLIRWVEYSKEAIFTSRTQELQICNKRVCLYAISHWLGSVLPHVVSLITFILYLMSKTPDFSLDASIAIPLMHTITYLIRPLKHLSTHLAYHLSGMASARRIYKYLNLHSNNNKDNLTREGLSTLNGDSALGANNEKNFDAKAATNLEKAPNEKATNEKKATNERKAPNEKKATNERKKTPQYICNFEEKLSKLASGSSPTVIVCQSSVDKLLFTTQLKNYALKLNYEYIHTSPTSWLPSGTVKSIITFYHYFNESIYDTITSVCGLLEDYQSWEDGDYRIIDERGGSLSTGQRTRIALARSLYHQEIKALDNISDIIHLIDNVFSVLDPGLAIQVFSALFTKTDNIGLLSKRFTLIMMDERQIRQIYQSGPSGFNILFYNHNLDPIPIETILSLFPDINCKNLGIKDNTDTESVDTPRMKIKNNTNCASDSTTPQMPMIRRYLWYLSNVGYYPLSILIICTILSAISHIISDFIIGKWTSEMANGRVYLYLFTIFTSLTIISDLCKSLYQAIGTISGAKNTYESSVSGVLDSPLNFYDNMPIGRILNRLSTDQNYVDQSLFHRFCEVISAVSSTILVLVSLCYLNPTCILIFPFFSFLVYCWVFKHYMGVNKDIMKRTLRKRTPLCTVCNQCIDGETIIRSFKAEDYMYQKYLDTLLEYQRMKFIKVSSVAWALLRLRALTLPLGFASAILTPNKNTFSNKSILNLDPTPRFGLALSYSFAFAKLIRHLINTLVQLETEMCCASRLQELSTTAMKTIYGSEERGIFESEHKSLLIEFPPDRLDFGNIHTLTNGKSNAYRFTKGHYGIVGRTGAGKSTLLNYISGIIPFDGRIELDGVNIKSISDRVMGQIVGVIPHEMPMITGWTIRNYVNPTGTHPDYLIYDALRKAGLTHFIKSIKSEDPLNTVLMDRDNNVNPLFTPLIVQHISLARLVLNSKLLRIILIDEPRHSTKTNLPHIGSIIKEYLSHCTTFIIAHHVTSLETCNLICLVEQGRIVRSISRDSLETQQDLIKFIN